MFGGEELSIIPATESEKCDLIDAENVFSEPWNKSDVVLVVEGHEFHVHRFSLSLQSPVFEAMFNGDFKEAIQDKIELKDETYQPMLQFLKLLYPLNMFDDDKGKVNINDENIFKILDLADKYGVINVVKQCMKEGDLTPENTMRLLPYAVRHELPLESIFQVITRHVPTEKLVKFAPELSNESVYAQSLAKKCRILEDVATQANTMMLFLLHKYVAAEKAQDSSKQPAKCVQHESFDAGDFKKARECENCLKAYKKYLIDRYVFSSTTGYVFGFSSKRQSQPNSIEFKNSVLSSMKLMDLLKLADDIETSLCS